VLSVVDGSGYLLFMRNGTFLAPGDLWYEAALASSTSPSGHEWPVPELMSTQSFRSPLVDKWNSMNVTQVKSTFCIATQTRFLSKLV